MITRRLFLRQSATMTAISAISVAPAVAAQIGPDENAELMQLDAEFITAYQIYTDADAALTAARARYHALKPVCPDDILVKPNQRSYYRFAFDVETDLDGTVWPDDPKLPPRQILSSEGLRKWFACFVAVDKSTRLRTDRQIALAKAYEASMEAAAANSGMLEALDAHYWALDALRRLLGKMRNEPARTIAGLMAKASAMSSYGACSAECAGYVAGVMGDALANDVLAVLGQVRS